MCSGRVDPLHIIESLKSGFDAVLVFGCHLGDCHYLEGNHYALKRVEIVRQLLQDDELTTAPLYAVPGSLEGLHE